MKVCLLFLAACAVFSTSDAFLFNRCAKINPMQGPWWCQQNGWPSWGNNGWGNNNNANNQDRVCAVNSAGESIFFQNMCTLNFYNRWCRTNYASVSNDRCLPSPSTTPVTATT